MLRRQKMLPIALEFDTIGSGEERALVWVDSDTVCPSEGEHVWVLADDAVGSDEAGGQIRLALDDTGWGDETREQVWVAQVWVNEGIKGEGARALWDDGGVKGEGAREVEDGRRDDGCSHLAQGRPSTVDARPATSSMVGRGRKAISGTRRALRCGIT